MKHIATVLVASIMVMPVAGLPTTTDQYPRWLCQLIPQLCY